MKTKFLSSFFVALLSLAVFSTSCKKEDTSTTDIETPGTILGKWHVRIDKTVFLDTNFNEISTGSEDVYPRGWFTFDFYEDGWGTVFNEGQSEPINYEVKDSFLIIQTGVGGIASRIDKLTSKELILTDYYYGDFEDNEIQKNTRIMNR
jgi:hypothetical protein